VLALLLAVGFALTLMVRPLRLATETNPAVDPLPRQA